jgi:hypothetical protein
VSSSIRPVDEGAANDVHCRPEVVMTAEAVPSQDLRGTIGATEATFALNPFVGRERELEKLSIAFGKVDAGIAQVVVVAGGPGVGKSRLAAEASRLFASRGVVLRASANDWWRSAPHLSLWTQLLVRASDRGMHIDEDWVWGNSDILDPARRFADTIEGEYAREIGRLHRIAAAIRQLAAEAPVVVTLDHLESADATSIGLLPGVVAGVAASAVLVLLAYDDAVGEPVERIITSVASLDPAIVHRLRLDDLSETEVGLWLSSVSARDLACEVVWNMTHGNPALVQLLLDNQSIFTSLRTGSDPVFSSGLRAAIQRHLRHLSPRVRETLSVASVFGRLFSIKQVADATETGADIVVDELDEALRAGILESAEGDRMLRFVHPVLRDVLNATIKPSVRSRLIERSDGEAMNHTVIGSNGVRDLSAQSRETVRARDLIALEGHTDLRMDAFSQNPAGGLVEDSRESEDGALELRGPRTSGLAKEDVPTTMRRAGEVWQLGFEGRTFSLKNRRGLELIFILVRHANREFRPAELEKLFKRYPETDSANDPQSFHEVVDPILDASAKNSYRQRLIELRDALEEARALNDLVRAEKIEEEQDFLTRELAQACGLFGRDRKFNSGHERARKRVTIAITRAISLIPQHDKAFGEHLKRSITTGSFCSYDAHIDPVRWLFN